MRCALISKKIEEKSTLINRHLIFNVIGFLLLLLEYGSGRLDIFVFKVMVVYSGK
jgi:hypothetical protein